jgi:hypothetical protein
VSIVALDHQQEAFVVNRQIALVVTIKILRPLFGSVSAGKEIKIEPPGSQLFPAYFVFAFRVQIGKYTPVFAKYIVDVPYIVSMFSMALIVMRAPALIGTKFLVYSPFHRFTALDASFVNSFWHITIRLQTATNESNRK